MREATRLYGSADPPSVNAIAQAAGVSRSTLYRIFPRRTTLLDALEIAPGPGTRQRVLDAALRLLASRSLADSWAPPGCARPALIRARCIEANSLADEKAARAS